MIAWLNIPALLVFTGIFAALFFAIDWLIPSRPGRIFFKVAAAASLLLLYIISTKFGLLFGIFGLQMLLANLLSDLMYLHPKLSFAASLALSMLLIGVLSSQLPREQKAYGLAGLMVVYSVASFFFEPRMNNVTDSNAPVCFDVFGQPRCLIPQEMTVLSSGKIPLYQLAAHYRMPTNKPFTSPEGAVLKYATQKDLQSKEVDIQAIGSIEQASCFQTSGGIIWMSCAYKKDAHEQYSFYKLNKSFQNSAGFPALVDSWGDNLTLFDQNAKQSYLKSLHKPVKNIVSNQANRTLHKSQPQQISPNNLGMQFVRIPAGTFWRQREGRDIYDEPLKPVQVSVSHSFLIQTTEVTQEQWGEIMGNNPSEFKGRTLPVEYVSWDDVQDYLKKLNSLNMGTYRLPTEDEWEYACLAGSSGDYAFGNETSLLGEYAWYSSNSNNQTHPVATKKPNAWGLYDMHGNVWEWTQTSDGDKRVLRGGSWYGNASNARCADRFTSAPVHRSSSLGFRLVRSE